MKRLLYAFLFSIVIIVNSYAQLTSCTQTLRLARSTYDQGRLHEIQELLSGCLKDGFTQQERVEGYKLLCLAYIYLEEPEKADEAMLNLLRTDHYFEINKTDPAEFVSLYKAFRTTPIYRLGLKLGANSTQPNVVSYVPANDGVSSYNKAFGFQIGFAGELPIKKALTFTPELIFALKNFTYSNKADYIEEETQQNRNFETKGVENMTWISLPLAVRYDVFQKKFENKNLKPFVALGVSTDLLLKSSNTFERTKQQSSSLEEQTVVVTSERNKLNISAIAAVGTKLKVTGGFVVVDARFSYGLSNINNKENIYSIFDKTLPTSGYVDGIFKLNSLSVSIGYVYNIFNPKKLKK